MKENLPQPSTVNCIIIDDEAYAVELLENLLAKDSRLRIIGRYSDSKQGLSAILHEQPDLIFLDIQMPMMNGFEIIEALYHTDVKPFIIFVTAYDEFAIKAIKASAFDFLLKPIDETELALSIERFILCYKQLKMEASYDILLEQTSKRKIRFNSTGGFILFNPDDIIYIQADWNYSEIHLGPEKHEVVTSNLGTVEHLLPKGRFARINRSVIINLAYLEKVQRSKRLCVLKKDGIPYEFKIPLLRIKYLEGLV